MCVCVCVCVRVCVSFIYLLGVLRKFFFPEEKEKWLLLPLTIYFAAIRIVVIIDVDISFLSLFFQFNFPVCICFLYSFKEIAFLRVSNKFVWETLRKIGLTMQFPNHFSNLRTDGPYNPSTVCAHTHFFLHFYRGGFSKLCRIFSECLARWTL